jgi:hypothetical protein
MRDPSGSLKPWLYKWASIFNCSIDYVYSSTFLSHLFFIFKLEKCNTWIFKREKKVFKLKRCALGITESEVVRLDASCSRELRTITHIMLHLVNLDEWIMCLFSFGFYLSSHHLILHIDNCRHPKKEFCYKRWILWYEISRYSLCSPFEIAICFYVQLV